MIAACFATVLLLFVFCGAAVHAESVTVKVSAEGVGGPTLVNQAVTVADGSTALTAIQAACGTTFAPTVTSYTYSGTTYHYVTAIKWAAHTQANPMFAANGFEATDSSNDIGKAYSYRTNINGVTAPTCINSTWWKNNSAGTLGLVNTDGYLSEKDYTYNSGWMLAINGSYNNNGVDTVVADGSTVSFEYTMFNGADLGQTAYVLSPTATSTTAGPWVTVNAFTSTVVY